MRDIAIAVTCLASLQGCGVLPSFDSLGFGGSGGQSATELPYRASLARGENRRDFTVSVRAGGVPVAEVRETVRFQATRYCLTNYGGSDADWVSDSATGDWAFRRDGETMIFAGRCLAR